MFGAAVRAVSDGMRAHAGGPTATLDTQLSSSRSSKLCLSTANNVSV